MYNVREAKFHIKHIHDLLRSVELADAYLGRDQMSLSFVNIITDGILSGEYAVIKIISIFEFLNVKINYI